MSTHDEDPWGVWWWLSFADSRLPAGSQFLGAAIVGPAHSIGAAAMLARMLGCNPGGEVVGEHVPDDIVERMPRALLGSLMQREQAEWLLRRIAGGEPPERWVLEA